LIKSKNIILVLLIIICSSTFLLLYYSRYYFQNLKITGIELHKTGNIIIFALFCIIVVLILANLLSKGKYRKISLLLVLLPSMAGLFSLIISFLFNDKINRIIFSSVFLLCYLFILISLSELSITKSKKVHIIKNLFIVILVFLVGISVIFFKIYNFTDDSEYYFSGTRKADAGVLLGAAVWGGNRPSPVLRDRINKAYDIYKKKIVSKLVLTGGGSPNEMSESEVSRNELIKYGVDKNNLIIESFSNSTIEQIIFLRDSIYTRNNWNKVILISDNYHLFRASQFCSFNNINADCISAETPHSTEGSVNYCLKESFGILFYWLFGIG